MKMKKMIYFLLATLAISACSESTVEENVINGEKSSVVSLYSEEGCTEASLLAGNVLVKEGTPLTVDLSVPTYSRNIYMKYASASGEQIRTLPLSDLVASVVGADASAQDASSFDYATSRAVSVSLSLPEDAVSATSEEDAGFRFYHNTGVAMFEDNWPIQKNQDNDLNDVVFEYDFKVTECQDEQLLAAQGYKEGLKLTLDVRAKGGLYPAKLGVVLEGLDSQYIDGTVTRIVLKSGQGMEKELAVGSTSADASKIFNDNQHCKVTVDTKNGTPVITMDGLAELGDNTNFFQTTRNYIIEGLPMLRAEITFKGKLRSELSATEGAAQLKAYRESILDTKKQNFFIVTKAGREIHMKGYQPTYTYLTKYEADSQGEMAEGTTYSNKNGFVWGIKVPVGLAHAYEKVLFDDAYPEYREWVNSNGTDKQDWYLYPNANNVVRYW